MALPTSSSSHWISWHGVVRRGAAGRPISKHRALVTPVKRGKGNKRQENSKTDDCTPAKRHAAMTWVQRLKRVFTKSRRHESKRFVRVTDKVTSTLSTHQIAACERSGRLSVCLVADCDWIDRRQEAILGVSAGISQISNARGSDDAASSFLYLVE